jgi:uncharacterized protein YhfF
MFCRKFSFVVVLALIVIACNNKNDDGYYDESSYVQKNAKDSADKLKALLASGNKAAAGANGIMVPTTPQPNAANTAGGTTTTIPVGQPNGGRITYTPEQVQAFTADQLQLMQDQKMFTPEQVQQIKIQQKQSRDYAEQLKKMTINGTVKPGTTTSQVLPTAKGMNPAHGQPGHRCDISPGAPLNSKPNAPITTSATTNANNTSTIPLAPVTYKPLGDSTK